MEPPALAAHAHRQQRRRPARPPRIDDLNASALHPTRLLTLKAEPRSAIASAALAAAALGLLGWDGGLLWIVAGVWTIRAMSGGPLGLAWGIAVVGAGMRWGTLGLGDLEVATRIAGPTVLSGALPVRVAMGAALVAAVVEEARMTSGSDGLAARAWGERAASMLALAAMPPLFLVRGPSQALSSTTIWWGICAAALTAAVLLGRRGAAAVPAWTPLSVALVGVAVGVLAS